MFVRCPAHPDWGLGQVQSRVGDIVTVNFAEMGKQVINATMVPLEVVWNVDDEH
ncbi:DUF3553 domain-containing protein [Roseinatronobacter ekhonensis]|jgi:hypothetical protein|uniref:DUF3553 domain-containing protein n=1 Tax=Roseinatronobacter ekhonensis TaxID=254356 RepID=UPI001FE41050|nr:DUF3553 domain-containing protein [Roseibaca ekhonensis]